EAELLGKSLYVYCPVAGIVSTVQRQPGQAVLAGEDILTIVNEHSEHIVSYVRQEHRIKPSSSMMVELRSRVDGGRPVRASVVRVGNNYEPIPVHQARDPKVLEWGIPILISVPFGMDIRPGELVEVRFGPNGDGSQPQ
ncbi:MAG TPA: HlyD family efflux transporter periplasmic adaptor subunit, partial [Tepidisphaeraceae bacterium]|nr:HlyD family efflux transporter periplasmic adaptor subunit [Tepidisphaeraceae bacterium]